MGRQIHRTQVNGVGPRSLHWTRWRVLRYLAAYGGEVASAQGRAGGDMGRALDVANQRSLASLLAAMETEGLVGRDINGRRCMRIWLTDKGKAAAASVPSAVPRFDLGRRVFTTDPHPRIVLDDDEAADEGEPTPALVIDPPAVEHDDDDESTGDVVALDPPADDDAASLDLGSLRIDRTPVHVAGANVDALAASLLALVIDKAGASSSSSVEVDRLRRDVDQARRRLADTLDDNTRLRRRLDLQADELAARRQEVGGLRSRIALLESNLAAAIEAVARGVVIDERRLRELDRLIREVPRTPVVKASA